VTEQTASREDSTAWSDPEGGASARPAGMIENQRDNPKDSMKEKQMRTVRSARGGHRATRATSRGLTLVELVIVITIIGVLTAAISIGVLKAQKSANVGAAKTACSTIRNATMQWKAINPGSDCATVDQLKAEKDLDTGFSLKDPWGNLYKVSCDQDEINCTSAGPDRKEGTDDDIHVPQIDTAESK
jgi:general secretion pathway protein G